MTEKKKRFINGYVKEPNATQAAIKAGYSPRTARSAGQRLLTNVDVQAAIKAKCTKIAEKCEADAEWVMTMLRDNAERAMQAVPVLDRKGKPTGEYQYEGSVANRALELIGKQQGMFVERTYTESGFTELTKELLAILEDRIEDKELLARIMDDIGKIGGTG